MGRLSRLVGDTEIRKDNLWKVFSRMTFSQERILPAHLCSNGDVGIFPALG